MNRLIFLLVFHLASIAAVAQNDAAHRLILALKLAPFSFFDFNGPTLQPGVGIRKGRWGVHAEYGFHANTLNQVQHSRKHYFKTSRLRTELRYYPKSRGATNPYGGFFAAAEGFWVDQQYHRSAGRVQLQGTGTVFLFDTALVHRKVAGFSAKGGYEIYLGRQKRFLLEGSAGMGLRQVRIRHNNVVNLREQNGGWGQALVDAFRIRANDEYEGARNLPHGAFTVRIGYRLF